MCSSDLLPIAVLMAFTIPLNTDVTALLIAPSTVEIVDLMVFQIVDIVLLIVFIIVVIELLTAVKSPVINPFMPLTTALMGT